MPRPKTNLTGKPYFQTYIDLIDSFRFCISGSKYRQESIDKLLTKGELLTEARRLLRNFPDAKDWLDKVVEKGRKADTWDEYEEEAMDFFKVAFCAMVDTEKPKLRD